MDFNGDVALATLQPAPVFPELYYPLWLWSGSAGGANSWTMTKGSNTTGSAINLGTISSSWTSSTKCALEITLWSNSSMYSAYAELVDATSGTIYASVSTSSTTATVVRSSIVSLPIGKSLSVKVYSGGSSSGGYSALATDASLIVFPSSPLTSPSVSAISLANPSENTLKESYIPLWVYSSGETQSASATAGVNFLQKGNTSQTQSLTNAMYLYKVNSSWNPSQKFAFEASFWSPTSGATVNVGLWDTNNSSLVSGSQVSVTSTTATLVRSGSFTLTQGHTYAVTPWYTTSGQVYLTKAHLVALAQ